MSDGWSATGNTAKIRLFNAVAQTTFTWGDEGPGAKMEVSQSKWKEQGVIGAETLRTYTEVPGDYKLGINTVGRMAKEGVFTASVTEATEPRANLDVVGTTFITGRTLVSYDNLGAVDVNNYLAEPGENKTYFDVTNAFLVGGVSDAPDSIATFRIATTDVDVADRTTTYITGGRVGINTSIDLAADRELDRNFVVIGDSRFTGNMLVSDDISIDGGDLNSTAETFKFLDENVNFFLGLGGAESISIGNNTTSDQVINIGNSVSNTSSHTLRIGANAAVGTFEVHKGSTSATVDIASVTDVASANCQVVIGGGHPNTNTITSIGTHQTKVAGTLEVSSFPGNSNARIFTQAATATLFDGQATTRLDLAVNSATVNIAGLGGNTTVRNSLIVQGDTTSQGSIILEGGLDASILKIGRGKFGTDAAAHVVGSLQNPNIDYLEYQDLGRFLDTGGTGPWGGSGDLLLVDNFLILTVTPASSTTWVANQTYTFLSATTTGNGEGALFNVTLDANGAATIELFLLVLDIVKMICSQLVQIS